MSRIEIDPQRRSAFGWLSSILFSFIYLIFVALFVALVAVATGIALAVLMVVLAVLGVNRIFVAISPTYRRRRAARGPVLGPQKVIETTATAMRSVQPRRRNEAK